MRLHGWCMRCHKIKRVTVTIPRYGSPQIGICDQCEEKRRG